MASNNKSVMLLTFHSDEFSKTYNIDTIGKGLSVFFLRGHRLKFQNFDEYMSLKIVLILANNADPDEMPPYVAFHLGLHCLPKYLLTGIKNEKV